MDTLVRWKKGNRPWSQWHVSSDGGELTHCGIEVPDETCGTAFRKETSLDGTIGCKHCSYSYFGLRPQFRRIAKGLQSDIRSLNRKEEA